MECFCGETVSTRGRYPCGHEACFQCVLRLRVLMNDDSCPYCRKQAQRVEVVPESGEHNSTFVALGKHNIFCATNEIRQTMHHLLQRPCPICDEEHPTNNALAEHLGRAHKPKVLCRVCLRNENNFTNQLKTYRPRELQTHLHEAHAECRFCNWHFYTTEELAKHCRKEHECCFICERVDPGRPQFFRNYETLQEHLHDTHYPCMARECLQDKFIVFSSPGELRAHTLEKHRDQIANVKEFQQLNLDEMASSRKSSRQPTPLDDSRPVKEMAALRYTERLKIDAKHDKGSIDLVNQANTTFCQKPVPVNVFIKTYEQILSVSHTEITALLTEFLEFAELNAEKKKELANTLAHRRSEETAPRQSRPSPVGWVHSKTGHGVKPNPGNHGILSNLPSLGSKPGKPAKAHSGWASPLPTPRVPQMRGPIARPAVHQPKPKPQQTLNQTRLPALTQRRTPSPLVSWADPVRPVPRPVPSVRSESPSERAPSEPRRLPRSLPRLNVQSQEQNDKKKGRILRIV